MKKVTLIIILIFASFFTVFAEDSLFVYESKSIVEDTNPVLNENTESTNRSDNTKEWIFAGASFLFALVIASGQVISSIKMAKSTIDTNNSTKLREENEKLEERCDNLIKQLYLMYKVEDIALIRELEDMFKDANEEGLTEQEKEKNEKKKNKQAIQLKKQTRSEAEDIVGYRFNSNYTRRNLLYRSKRTQLDKKSIEATTFTLYETIE